jgi:hypothetical protein
MMMSEISGKKLPDRPKTQSTPLDRFRMELETRNIDTKGVGMWHIVDELEEDAPFLNCLMSSSWFQRDGLGVQIPDDFFLYGLDDRDTDKEVKRGEESLAAIRVAIRGARAMHGADSWVRGDLAWAYLTAISLSHIDNWSNRSKEDAEKTLANFREHQLVVPRREQLKELAQMFGVSVKRLENNMTTAKAWKHEDRYPSHMLSNSHHEVLNALSPELRTEWAERIIAESLSVGRVREMLKNEGISIKVEYNESGDVVEQHAEFVAEPFKAEQAIHTIGQWYESERKRFSWMTEKQVLTNVLETFERAGLLRFPLTPWQNAIATGNSLTNQPTE